MQTKRKALIAAGAAVALAAGGVGVANAVGGDDDAAEQATGAGAERAKVAALRIIPGGTVNAVERDSEKGATWEVEVRRPDGSVVDVRLDARYGEVAVDSDSEAPDDAD